VDSSSREAYAPVAGRINELVAAGGAGATALAGVADEILGIAEVLGREPRLRRALADPSRTGAERAELLGSLVDGKVSGETASLLRTLVSGRWSSGNELLNTTERLGVEALLASAQAAGELAEVEDELFRFGQVVDRDLALASALGASSAPAAQRAELARTLLAGKVRPATVRLVTVALHGFGGRGFVGSLGRIVELAAQRRARQIAYVTVASPLGSAEADRLANRLTQIYGRPVEIKVTVAPEVLGGASVRIGDDLYDGTVRRRLNETRAALVSRD
jgi:F-type H+-transporting ATPase subunit delta